MTTALATLTNKLAARFDMGDGEEVVEILKSTAFKGPATDAQLTALLVVSNQYGLNPWTKEIFAYPDKNNGIVPVVSVDGWSRIINERPELDGIEFRYSDETTTHKGKLAHTWIECVITRKDRKEPIVVREFFDEVVRNANFATPWDTHPKRMHRHKALIQCSRVAFGYGGIYDQDEAERIVEKDMGNAEVVTDAPISNTRTEALKNHLGAGKKKPAITVEQVIDELSAANTPEELLAAAEKAKNLTGDDKAKAGAAYTARLQQLKAAATIDQGTGEIYEAGETPAIDPDDAFLKGLEHGQAQ